MRVVSKERKPFPKKDFKKPGAGGFRKPGGGKPRWGMRKQNRFHTIFPPHTVVVDFKESDKLSKFITEKGKIIPRRITGLTAKQQRSLARAIHRARHAGLLPFQVE